MGDRLALTRADAARSFSGWLAGTCLLLLVGFGVRLSFYLGHVYHIDEYISMLAATMVAQRGLPILPSGLFYDHGLLFSLLSGAFVALLGFSEEVARWPTLLISVLTIAVYYAAAKELFGSRIAGLLACALVAFDGLSIEWGARARMYALAHLFVLLSVASLLKSTLKNPSRRGRYLFLLFLGGALLSHTISFIIVPTLAILLFLFTLIYRREWLSSPGLWQQVLIALVVLIVAMAVVAVGQTGSTVSLQDSAADSPPPLGLEFLRGFFLPGLEWSRFDDLIGFFLVPGYRWLFILIFLSLLLTLYRLLRHTVRFSDVAFLFLALFVATTVLELGGLFTHNWQKTRYLFMVALPAFLLLSAESLARLLRGAAFLLMSLSKGAVRPKLANTLVSVAGIGIVVGAWGPTAWDVGGARGTGDYNTAFAAVRENWQPGDRVMTVHPSAAFLYLGRCDYYANQVSAKVLSVDEDAGTEGGTIVDTDSSLVDRYTGSPLIDSAEELNTVLAEGHRIWFVVDQSRLYRRYDLLFVQQVFAQMDVFERTGGVLAFLRQPYPRPIPEEPAVSLNANFSDMIELGGYSLDLDGIAPDGTVQLGLYWQPLVAEFSKAYKVFVQLRNEDDQIVAQADHFVFENLLTASVLIQAMQKGQWLRDTADLELPADLPSGTYRLLVGLYDPDTSERLPLVVDQSGENAVILETVSIP
jgi:4-amino-4-deoxy-L-arabinose transferase-like glycosyltransferase